MRLGFLLLEPIDLRVDALTADGPHLLGRLVVVRVCAAKLMLSVAVLSATTSTASTTAAASRPRSVVRRFETA